MKHARYTIDQILSMPRPLTYLDELKDCAVSSDEVSMILDLDGDCFKAMKAKYAGYQPTQEETERAEKYKIEVVRKNAIKPVIPPSVQTKEGSTVASGSAPVRTGGCGGCKGRRTKS